MHCIFCPHVSCLHPFIIKTPLYEASLSLPKETKIGLKIEQFEKLGVTIVKRTKSKTRMQITEFPTRHKRACSEGNTGNVDEVFVSQVFYVSQVF